MRRRRSATTAGSAAASKGGDAADEVLGHLSRAERPTALLFGGETTVRLSGSGRGGRNQEMALRVALAAPGRASPFPPDDLLETGIGIYLRGLGLVSPDE